MRLKSRYLVSAILLSVSFASAQTPATEKKYKDNAEYELYNDITKAFAANDYAKAITGLDTWVQKYPESDYKNDRQLLFVQAYSGAAQPGKAIDAAGPLLAMGDPSAIFPDPASVIRLLYTPTAAIQQIAEPTPEQLKIATMAAQQLAAFDKMPKGMADADWQKAKAEFQKTSKAAQMYIVLVPIGTALRNKDCAAGESLATQALTSNPTSAQVAFYLGSAALCLQKTDPTKAMLAIYEFARAASLDPVAGMVDPKWQQTTAGPNFEKLYTFYHGPDPEGMKQLKELSTQSPLPPAGFTIKSKAQLQAEKQEAFDKDNPELALWMKIKSALVADNGEQYFEGSMKGAALPKLVGVLVDAKPACRPTQLLVAIRGSQDQAMTPEITLKLEKAMTGKPELNAQIKWEGVPSAFTKTPFNLTMDVDGAKVEGLKSTPCAPAAKKK